MPTYLCHGFRWPRPLIRIHIILQNLDDAAAEWLMAPATTSTLLSNFKTLYPSILPQIPNLTFLEQYDPFDERAESKSQPYAYVCDVVQEVKLGVEVDEVRGKGVTNEGWNAIMELRDGIAPGEKVAWFVVVCGDTERYAPPTVGLLENGVVQNPNGTNGHTSHGPLNRNSLRSNADGEERPQTSKGGIRKWFGKRDGKKSQR